MDLIAEFLKIKSSESEVLFLEFRKSFFRSWKPFHQKSADYKSGVLENRKVWEVCGKLFILKLKNKIKILNKPQTWTSCPEVKLQ